MNKKVLTFFLRLSLPGTEKKCGTFDLGCKTKRIIDNTKEFQKKGYKESKETLGKAKEKVFKSKDVVFDDVKDTVGGVKKGVGDIIGGVKKEFNKKK